MYAPRNVYTLGKELLAPPWEDSCLALDHIHSARAALAVAWPYEGAQCPEYKLEPTPPGLRPQLLTIILSQLPPQAWVSSSMAGGEICEKG
jgi:hypothetical protein